MAGEIISERRATSNRNGARDHPGIPGDFSRNQQVGATGLPKTSFPLSYGAQKIF
jgi:hypothetical protein